MAHVPILKVAGLHTNNNELSAVPDGALAVADDVVIRAKDVLEPRRGQYEISALQDHARQIMPYGEGFLIQDTSTDMYHYTPGGEATLFTTAREAPSDNQRMRSLETAGNVYFTTSEGVFKSDDITQEPYAAGAPKTADLGSFFNTSRDLGDTSPGFLEAGNKVAYRIVFVKKDLNNNLLIGSPSGRCFSINSHATDTTNVRVFIPVPVWIDLGANVYVRVYRTSQAPSDVDPGDEMSLVKETLLSATTVTGGVYSFTDRQPDELRGVPLYTNNNSGEGILQANEPPPLAHDIAFWQGRSWFANTSQPQRLFLDVLGVGAGDTGATGIRVGDVLTLSGRKFLFFDPSGISTDEDGVSAATYNEVLVYDDFFDTVALNLEASARNLVYAINVTDATYFTVPIRSYYISGATDTPGKLVVEALKPNTSSFSATLDTLAMKVTQLSRTGTTVTVTMLNPHGLIAGDTFALTATTPHADFGVGTKTVIAKTGDYTFTYSEAGTATSTSAGAYRAKRLTPNPGLAWNPELPKTDGSSGFTVESEAETEVQRLYYSKIQQPEAVPLVNWLDVGIKGRKILRILPLRDKLFVLKEDGMYMVSGEAPFVVDLLDNTAHLLAPDTAVTVNNQIFCLTNQGVVSVSEGGVQVVSRAIEPSIIQLFNPELADFTKANSFAVSRETDRLYELWVPVLGEEIAYPQRAFVYNVVLGVWTNYNLERTCGVVNPVSDILVMGAGDFANLVGERRDLESTDYYDELVQGVVVDSVNTTTHTLSVPGEISNFSPGDVFVNEADTSVFFIVDTVNVDDDTVTYKDNGQTLGSVDTISIYKAIPCAIEWATQSAGSANDLKQFVETHYLFRKAHFNYAKATFGTDVVTERAEIEFVGTVSNGATDSVYWGDYDIPFQKRVTVDSQHQMATFFRPGLNITEAMSYWTLSGITIDFLPISNVTGQ